MIEGSPVLSLIPTVLTLDMVIVAGGGWTLGLAVTDTTGAAVALTGTTAAITLPNGSVWTATNVGNVYSWDIAKSVVDTVLATVNSGKAVLTVSDGVHTTVWASGKVRVL